MRIHVTLMITLSKMMWKVLCVIKGCALTSAVSLHIIIKLRFCIKEGSKRFNNNEKGVNKIENPGKNWYKLLQKCPMTDICEKIDQI